MASSALRRQPIEDPFFLGTTVEFSYTVRDDDGQPVDLSGYQHRMLLKRRTSDAEGVEFTIDTSQAAQGQFTATLTPSQTRNLSAGTYVADHRVKEILPPDAPPDQEPREFVVAAFRLRFYEPATPDIPDAQ